MGIVKFSLEIDRRPRSSKCWIRVRDWRLERAQSNVRQKSCVVLICALDRRDDSVLGLLSVYVSSLIGFLRRGERHSVFLGPLTPGSLPPALPSLISPFPFSSLPFLSFLFLLSPLRPLEHVSLCSSRVSRGRRRLALPGSEGGAVRTRG